MYIYMYACMHVRMYVCSYACMYACMYVCKCMCTCMYVCMCICVSACLYSYVHVEDLKSYTHACARNLMNALHIAHSTTNEHRTQRDKGNAKRILNICVRRECASHARHARALFLSFRKSSLSSVFCHSIFVASAREWSDARFAKVENQIWPQMLSHRTNCICG